MFVRDICRIFGTNLKNICKNMGQILGILWRKSEKKIGHKLKKVYFLGRATFFFQIWAKKYLIFFARKEKFAVHIFQICGKKFGKYLAQKGFLFLYIIENFCECRAVSPTAMLA